jgi:hypothetical protein
LRDLRQGIYDLVALPSVDMSYGYDPHWRKLFVRRLVRATASTRVAAAVLEAIFHLRKNVVVFMDVSDVPALSYEVCTLVPDFLCYFKREFVPGRTLRAEARWQKVNDHVVPSSLFLPTADFVPDAAKKTTDVFFAGHCNNVVRQQGLPQLQRLGALGYKIDVPAGRLEYQEYLQRLAQAWLVWSPEGYGWDCYRHYEAAFAGSVPVINTPDPHRVRPYEDGTECFYYQPENDGLQQVIVEALNDKMRLRAMAERARIRVLTRYTRQALVASMQTVILQCLRAEGRSSRLLDAWSGEGRSAAF